jgi:hypothetical protein
MNKMFIRREMKKLQPEIPKGLRPPAQGWRAAPTLGSRFKNENNLNEVVAGDAWMKSDWWPSAKTSNHVAVENFCGTLTQGSSVRAGRATSQPWALGRNPIWIRLR